MRVQKTNKKDFSANKGARKSINEQKKSLGRKVTFLRGNNRHFFIFYTGCSLCLTAVPRGKQTTVGREKQ